jgi:hypothetical protein
MLTFRQILEDDAATLRDKFGLSPKEYIFYYKDKWIIDTKHSIARVTDRGVEDKAVVDLLKKSIDWVVKTKAAAKEQVYLFVSKSTNQAIVLDHRKDNRHRVKGNILAVVTYLGDVRKLKPKGKDPKTVTTTHKGDKKVIVESLMAIKIDLENLITVEV